MREEAKRIHAKYVAPPHTTDFAVLYLPTEGLYAEVIRRPGLFENLQREHRVTVAGPTTLSALLNSLQMGFRTLAIAKRSSEVWKILGAVKTEFGKFGVVLDKTPQAARRRRATASTAPACAPARSSASCATWSRSPARPAQNCCWIDARAGRATMTEQPRRRMTPGSTARRHRRTPCGRGCR